jgi:hypothetical protein
VQDFAHTWNAGFDDHCLGFPEDCTKCGDNIAEKLQELHDGEFPIETLKQQHIYE